MKVMILTKMTEATENMVPPSEEAIVAMHNYNEALIAAGILKDQVYGGLMPSNFAKRLQYSGKNLHGDRRAVYRDEGSGRRIRAVGGQVLRRSARVGQEVPRDDGLHGRTSSRVLPGNVRPAEREVTMLGVRTISPHAHAASGSKGRRRK